MVDWIEIRQKAIRNYFCEKESHVCGDMLYCFPKIPGRTVPRGPNRPEFQKCFWGSPGNRFFSNQKRRLKLSRLFEKNRFHPVCLVFSLVFRQTLVVKIKKRRNSLAYLLQRCPLNTEKKDFMTSLLQYRDPWIFGKEGFHDSEFRFLISKTNL